VGTVEDTSGSTPVTGTPVDRIDPAIGGSAAASTPPSEAVDPADPADSAGPAAPPVSRRRWLLRGFVVAVLLAGAVVVALAAAAILGDSGRSGSRQAAGGVAMPDDAHFRDIAGQLLGRRTPERISGMTIAGAAGEVTVIRYAPGRTSFLSSYLNPNALGVIARAIGARSDDPITVDELRLEVLRATGRQRWRLRGTQGGELWRATVNPNGTDLRIISPKAG
jgi:hypothetical protein